MSRTIIKVDNISKKFGKREILKKLDLEIHEGEIYGIIGMSGSGKSTLLNIMADLVNPDEGNVYYKLPEQDKFYNISKKSKLIKKTFGFSFQAPSFHPMLTVQENLEHFSTLYGIPKKFGIQNSDTLLKLVELSDAKKVLGRDLSGGMQKRLGFACPLVHSPKILFLDEPTSNLDPLLRKETWKILQRINKKGTTIIIASQLLTELDDFCDRIAILDQGRIIKEGPVNKIKKDYCKDTEIHLESSPGNYKKIISELNKSKSKFSKIINHGVKLVIYSTDAEKTLHSLIHIIEKLDEELIDIDLNAPSLTEVYESLITNK